MIKRHFICLLALPVIFLAACSTTERAPESVDVGTAAPVATSKELAPAAVASVLVTPIVPVPEIVEYVKDVRIIMHTSEGVIEATLFATKTPVTVANFLNLAKCGYYDGLIFHRVIAKFMIQGGDPTGTGRGGPGYQICRS